MSTIGRGLLLTVLVSSPRKCLALDQCSVKIDLFIHSFIQSANTSQGLLRAWPCRRWKWGPREGSDQGLHSRGRRRRHKQNGSQFAVGCALMESSGHCGSPATPFPFIHSRCPWAWGELGPREEATPAPALGSSQSDKRLGG